MCLTCGARARSVAMGEAGRSRHGRAVEWAVAASSWTPGDPRRGEELSNEWVEIAWESAARAGAGQADNNWRSREVDLGGDGGCVRGLGTGAIKRILAHMQPKRGSGRWLRMHV